MTKSKLGMSALISHRFRGFAARENTLEGLKNALDFGVLNLEFDVRMAACGTPMIYHDEHAADKNGKLQMLCEHKASSYSALGGTFAHMPSLDELLHFASAHKNLKAKLLIDIKDLGFEREIHALVCLYRLETRTVFVSWLPEVLYRLHEFAPHIPKCLSHWCMAVTPQIMTDHIVYPSKDGVISRRSETYVTGERSGWAVEDPITGDMLALLIESGGGVCVPQVMLTRALSDYYHGHSLFVSTFSYTDWPSINAHQSALGVDLFFIDNKRVFEDLI